MAKPQNDTTTAISMTAPVLMSHAGGKAADTPVGPSEGSEGESTYKMAFFMPASRFSKASDAPNPHEPQRHHQGRPIADPRGAHVQRQPATGAHHRPRRGAAKGAGS
jgi:hypothetical protein